MLHVGPSKVEVTVKALTLQGAEGYYLCKEREKGLCPAGLAAAGNSEVKVKGVTISGNGLSGIYLQDSSRVTVDNSELLENKWNGIFLQDSAQATVKSSEITGNEQGIYLSGSSQATVKNSEIKENSGDGIELEDSSRVTVDNSEITENELFGIELRDSAQATVKSSEITGNEYGIELQDSAQATLQNNSIRKNDIGVANYSDNKIEFYDNEITNNLVNFTGNIVSRTRDKLMEPTKEKIRLPNDNYLSLQHAIDALLPGGRIVITGKLTGEAVIDKKLTIESGGKNATLSPSHEGIAPILSLINGAKLNLNGITLEGSGGDAIVVGGNGKLVVEKSIITGSGSNGISLRDSSRATVESSKISGKGLSGIYLQDSSRVTVDNSEITENELFGIELRDSAQATVTVKNSKISGNEKYGIWLEGSTWATITNNTIRKNKCGIAAYSSGTITGSGNQITDNDTNYIGISSRTWLNITRTFEPKSLRFRSAAGTGFLVDESGYILTNEHVIHGAGQVTAEVAENEYQAKVVSSSENKDLALLKIPSYQNLPALPLGNSDSLKVGDTVIAMGCPGRICGTVTQGRIANLKVGKEGFIMTDLTIAHGSSGGPLFNQYGEVIGITTAGFTRKKQREGTEREVPTGFSLSIPINKASNLLNKIPNFDREKKGEKTDPLSLSEITERTSPSVAYIKGKSMIPMTSLVPHKVSGEKCEISTPKNPLLFSSTRLQRGNLQSWIRSSVSFKSPQFTAHYLVYDFPISGGSSAKQFVQLLWSRGKELIEKIWEEEFTFVKRGRETISDLKVYRSIFYPAYQSIFYSANRNYNLQGLYYFRIQDLAFLVHLKVSEKINPTDFEKVLQLALNKELKALSGL